MGMVTFLAAPFRRQHVLRVQAGGWRTLLNLARRLDLPLRCQCQAGACGTCAVKVAVLRPGNGGPGVRLGAEEKAVLYRAGKLTREQYESDTLPASPPLWRLACQYVVWDEDILVAM